MTHVESRGDLMDSLFISLSAGGTIHTLRGSLVYTSRRREPQIGCARLAATA